MLVETQDKALRRISELREQCSLEQQAKAHLESALRLDMDEQQCTIKALKTKLSLLGENPEEIVKNGNEHLISLGDANGSSSESENLININDGADVLNDSTDRENQIAAGASIIINDSNEKIKGLEAQLNALKCQIADEKKQSSELSRLLEQSQKQVKELIAREEENTIMIAQNKLAIHSELENKEKEMKSLKNDAKQTASEKECLNEIVTELRQSNSKANASVKELSDAKRALEEKVEELKKNATTAEQMNKELRAKVIVLESEKQSATAKNSLELEKFKARYDSLQRKNEQLEEITRSRVIESHEKLETELKHLKLAHADISKQLNDEQTENKELNRKYQEFLNEHQDTIKRLSVDFDSAKADKMKLETRFKQLFEEKSGLTAELEALKTNINQSNSSAEDLKSRIEQLTQENAEAKEKINELNESLQSKLDEAMIPSADIISLKEKIDTLKNDKRDLEKTLEKEIREKSELQIQVTNILQEIGRLEEQLKEVKESYSQLEQEKLILEEKSAMVADSATNEQVHVQELMSKVKEFETKLKAVECENSQLAEKNCLLEENNNRLHTSIKEFESNLKKESASVQAADNRISTLIAEIESLKEENINVQDKLKKSLADYADLFNSKEQMDQEHRSMLDRITALESEKTALIAEQDALKKREQKLNSLIEESKNNSQESAALQIEHKELIERFDQLSLEVNDAKSSLEKAESKATHIQTELDEQIKLKNELETAVRKLNSEKDELQESVQKLNELENSLDGYDQTKIENEYLNKSIQLLETDVKSKSEENQLLNKTLDELKEKTKSQQCELYVLTEEKNERSKVFEDKDQEIEQLKSICQRTQAFSEELQSEVKQLNEQLSALKLLNDEVQGANESSETKIEKLTIEYESLKQSFNQNETELKEKINELTSLRNEFTSTQSEIDAKTTQISDAAEKVINSQKELDSCRAIINDLNHDLNDQSSKIEISEKQIEKLQTTIAELEAKLAAIPTKDDTEELKRANETLKCDLAETKANNLREINELNHEIDELKENARAYREKQLETEQLKATNEILTQQLHQLQEQIQQNEIEKPIKSLENHRVGASAPADHNSNDKPDDLSNSIDKLTKEKEDLEHKLNKIVNEVLDVSNRNSFLEQQVENYLIIEQQNERLKLQNSKLSRQLDETLVSLVITENRLILIPNSTFKYACLYSIRFQCTILMTYRRIPNSNI